MIGMVVRKKYAVNIVVGDSQIEQLSQVSVAKIDERVNPVVLNENTGRIALQGWHGCA